MLEDSSIDWVYSFRLDDGLLMITDNCILIDHKYVMPAELPPEGEAGKYRRVKKYLSLPILGRFGFDSLVTTEILHYEGPDAVVLNRKYISFLVERIPQNLLVFGMTGDRKAPVWICRGDEPIGLLMPMLIPPPYDARLVDEAVDGDAESQYFLGCYYLQGDGPVDKDYVLARKWFEAAAAQDHPEAAFQLGLMYVVGKGCDDDRDTAMKYLDRAVALGCKDAIPWRHRMMQHQMLTRSELFEELTKWLMERDEGDSE